MQIVNIIRPGYVLHIAETNERITFTGSRKLRGQYIYTFRDQFGKRGAISRNDVLNAQRTGAASVLQP